VAAPAAAVSDAMSGAHAGRSELELHHGQVGRIRTRIRRLRRAHGGALGRAGCRALAAGRGHRAQPAEGRGLHQQRAGHSSDGDR
jgi:hypothetical protein